MTDKRQAGPYRTLAEIKAANASSGQRYWFSPDTMRFFRSVADHGVIGGRYFVTSEQYVPYDGDPDPRRFTVRVANDDGTIGTVGDFQAHDTLEQARAAARALVSA